jgi:hypothetical protein
MNHAQIKVIQAEDLVALKKVRFPEGIDDTVDALGKAIGQPGRRCFGDPGCAKK